MSHSGAHILIADDEETFRLSTAALLQREGYTCDCAGDSEAALRRLPDDYDLLLADIRMPGNMEFEFLHEVHARMPDLPVVVVTGYPSLPTAVEACRLAIVDYLIKPVDLEDLKRAIARAVEKGRLHRAVKAAAGHSSALAEACAAMEASVAAMAPHDRPAALTWTAEQCVEQALTSIGRLGTLAARILSGLKGPSLLSAQAGQTDACRLLQCPRRQAYEEAIRDTVAVIERSKQAFKSRELASLRQRLESLLQMSAPEEMRGDR